MFYANKCRIGECIFVFSLRMVVMYTAVGSIQFSPLWVDGSRTSAGHCCLWPRGAIEGGLNPGVIAAPRHSARPRCQRSSATRPVASPANFDQYSRCFE